MKGNGTKKKLKKSHASSASSTKALRNTFAPRAAQRPPPTTLTPASRKTFASLTHRAARQFTPDLETTIKYTQTFALYQQG